MMMERREEVVTDEKEEEVDDDHVDDSGDDKNKVKSYREFFITKVCYRERGGGRLPKPGDGHLWIVKIVAEIPQRCWWQL